VWGGRRATEDFGGFLPTADLEEVVKTTNAFQNVAPAVAEVVRLTFGDV
jgi:hypothetical protein